MSRKMVTSTIEPKGRVQIPAEVRHASGLEPGMQVDVSLYDGGVMIMPTKPRCCICHKTDTLLAEFGTDPVRHICTACANEIACKPLAFNPTK